MTALTPELKQQVNSDSRANFTLQADKGVLVFRVMQNSPAAKAGMQPGDVIQKIDGQVVTTPDDVQQAVEKSTVGGTLKIDIQRQNQTVSLSVRPEAFPTRTAQN
jgi:S1-C subfamily serine protease